MDGLISQREKLTNKMRRAEPEEKELLSQQKRGVANQITKLRRDLKLALGVEKRSLDMAERLKITDEIKNREKQKNKERSR